MLSHWQRHERTHAHILTGIPHGVVSRTAWYPTRHGIPPGMVSALQMSATPWLSLMAPSMDPPVYSRQKLYIPSNTGQSYLGAHGAVQAGFARTP